MLQLTPTIWWTFYLGGFAIWFLGGLAFNVYIEQRWPRLSRFNPILTPDQWGDRAKTEKDSEKVNGSMIEEHRKWTRWQAYWWGLGGVGVLVTLALLIVIDRMTR